MSQNVGKMSRFVDSGMKNTPGLLGGRVPRQILPTLRDRDRERILLFDIKLTRPVLMGFCPHEWGWLLLEYRTLRGRSISPNTAPGASPSWRARAQNGTNEA
jgi:hypothetical protein